MKIQFPDSESPSSDGIAVHFSAIAGKRTVRCSVSLEALEGRYGKNELGPIDTFLRHRKKFEGIAARLIDQGRYENNGSIFIRSYDIL